VRIGVDGACWANRRGYGRFAREVVAAMVAGAPEHEFVCFVDEASERALPLAAPNARLVRVRQGRPPAEAAAADGARSPWDMLRLTRAVARERLDVFFSPSVYTYFPLPPRLPAVVTIHDAIAERHPELTLPTMRARLFWRVKVAVALHQARLVLTVSEYARRDVARVHGLDETRLRVALEAPAAAYRPRTDPAAIAAAAGRAGLPAGASWFAYVGGFNPHKNVDVLIRAHARYARELAPAAPPHLVLVGAVQGDVFHGSLESLRALVGEAGSSDLVHWPGYLPDDELSHLLSGAIALALVSEAEGFGLPAVEAAACGCPVVATLESPLPQLLEGGGLFVAPGDEDALLDALRTLHGNPYRRGCLASAALARASALSWPGTARAVLDALQEAVA
jgi:glycosyltransferase involved in cell wall biosynthesis